VDDELGRATGDADRRRLWGTGNQLAVVRHCGHMDTSTMQAIAREMNFAETTFVVEEGDGEARVRIFTPAQELPFAGHPTLGTAWVLGRGRSAYTLDLAVGRVPVTFDASGIAWLQSPPVTLGDALPLDLAAGLLGLAEADIDQSHPCRYAEVGPRFALIGVQTIDALRRSTVNATIHADLAENDFLGVFVFTQPGYSGDADFAARMFFNANGWREDPATGSSNAALAAHLREQRITGAFVVEQGVEIARPSRIYLRVGDLIQVGGKVRPVMVGDLCIG
jgi:trans-2,3-dihydro-3-hydroxyanthranilate isomerase